MGRKYIYMVWTPGLTGFCLLTSVSQHLGPGFSICSPWTAQKCKFSGHTQNQKLGGWGPATCILTSLEGILMLSSLRTSALEGMQRGLDRVHLPLTMVTVPWLHFIYMYYLQGLGSPRLPLHVPISSITHNQIGPGTRITCHQNLQNRVVWRSWNAEGWELSFPCIWVTLDNICLF